MICKAHSNAYKNAKCKDEKTKITRTIVENLGKADPPSRFIQKCEDTEDTEEPMWVDIGEKKAWEKTSQLLREMVSKGNHPTVYQKRKWDKELKRIELKNAKKLKSEQTNLSMAHTINGQQSVDPSRSMYSPMAVTGTFQQNSPTLATRGLFESTNLGQIATRTPVGVATLLSPASNVIVSQVQAPYQPYQTAYLTSQQIDNVNFTSQSPLESQLNPLNQSRLDSIATRGTTLVGDVSNSHSSDLMQLWLQRNSAITELEQSIILRQQIEQANQQKAPLLQGHNTGMYTAAAPMPASFGYFASTHLNQQPQQSNIGDVPHSVTPSWTN